MQIEANDELGKFLRALPIVVVVGALAYLFLIQLPPPPAPANSIVFGCYTAPDSPSILLDASGMHVRQRGYPIIPFHLERSKTGIVLTAEAPIRADRTAEGYRFARNERGVGWFLNFYRVENGRIYGVFGEKLLEGFQMLASDGAYLNYEPTEDARCSMST